MEAMGLISFCLLQAALFLAACFFALKEGKGDSDKILLEIVSGRKKFHRQNWFRRAGAVCGLLLPSFFLAWYCVDWLPALLQAASGGLLMAMIFMILFNGSVNYLLGKKIFREGTTAGLDIAQAKMFQKLPAWFEQALALYVVLVLYIYFTVALWQN